MTKYLDNEGLTHFTGKMKGYADGKAGEADSKVTTHVGNKKNPHGVTKAQVGLGSVDNVQQIPLSQRGTVNGVATLDAKGKIPVTQMPTTKTINGASIFGTGNLQLSASLYKIVDALPTTGIDTSKIYLVPASATTAKNNKTEYIYLGDPNKAYDESKWEKLGDEQKSSTVTTPGGSITVDTALIENSPNPVAGGVVKAKIDEIDGKLAKKVESSDYNTKMTAIDSTLEDLKKKETTTVDAELKDSPNPVQNRAVNKAVNDLNTEIGKKANDADLTTAKGRIDTLESNSISINDITLIPVTDGNGIASIEKQNKKLVITQGKFVTSLIGYVTSGTLKTTLAGYAKSETLASYYTKKEIDGKGYLTEHQSLADYATKTWVGEQDFVKGTIPTKVSDLTNDSGYLVDTVKKAHFNELYIEESPESNGIADIWIDNTNKKELCVRKAKFVNPENLETAIDSYASDKGYLTENNLNEKLKETVTIKLVSDKSESDTNLNGATVTVKSGNTTVSTQTWQGTPINVKVPCDKDVTIEAAAVKMYVKPKMLKYVPSPLYNREVTFTYKALETGVFIIDKNNRTYKTVKEFTDSGTDIKDVIGTLLVTDNAAIVVANYNSEYVSWGPNVLVDGCTVANDTTTAVQDFAGAANTAAIMKATGSSSQTAAYICYNYIFGNGRRGHLMSAGEGAVIQKMRFDIQRLMSQIGIDDSSVIDSNKYYWTSTQISASKVYRYRFYESTPGDDTKGNVNYAIPICSLFD